MTPAIKLLEKSSYPYTVHRYEHDPSCASYGTEAAEKLGVSADKIFKTLLILVDKKKLIVAVLPISKELSLKIIAVVSEGKKAALASQKEAERSTGYMLGGISPIAQKKKLPTFVDDSAISFETIHISAGKRGLEVELNPQDLVHITAATTASITR